MRNQKIREGSASTGTIYFIKEWQFRCENVEGVCVEYISQDLTGFGSMSKMQTAYEGTLTVTPGFKGQ